ncbi:MAG: GNAT family N-acetyltransferase [Candidatus Heimdallarchaeota archaeon]|nr:GNAT family N-acetyltransferase [Candidatus Heimdallarchaeota archaeon]MCK4769020.1 GNAT family N-acetyltransferase [Candidatus Heimdallarchaeota archaeon]
MNKVEIKELRGEDVDPILELAFYAFFPTPGNIEQIMKRKPYMKEDTCLVLYENEKPVSGLICKPIPQNVRGVIKDMCGISEVATHPEGRRKGYAKKLMKSAFDKMKENNQGFSTLYPFKESFYERLGYVSFPQIRTAIISAKSLVPLLDLKLEGTVERMSFDEGFETYKKFLNEIKSRIHGMGVLHDAELERYKDEKKMWVITAKGGNETIGIMTYSVTGFWKDIKVRDFYCKNSLARYLFLQWFALHADQIKNVHIPIKPNEYPETWLNDTFWGEYGKIQSRVWVPSCMGRIVSVEDMSDLEVGHGKISVKIKDDYCEWNNKIYTFEGKEGKLSVVESKEYECELSIQALSAIVYGCYNLDDFEFKGWAKLSEENKEKITELFPQIPPHLHADF